MSQAILEKAIKDSKPQGYNSASEEFVLHYNIATKGFSTQYNHDSDINWLMKRDVLMVIEALSECPQYSFTNTSYLISNIFKGQAFILCIPILIVCALKVDIILLYGGIMYIICLTIISIASETR